jgi:transcriptional regulator with XRE-family HTH domain
MSGKKNADNDEIVRQQIGERLRQSREYLGLSQDEVAKHLGIPRTALTNIESGQRRVEALELKKLADLYRQPLKYFTDGESEDESFSSDVTHLARSASQLSAKDREELARFAEFLRSRATSGERKK